MVKIFISQPMGGRTKEEILSERSKAISILKNDIEFLGQNIEIADSYFENYKPDNGCVPLKHLAKSIELLADADILLCIGDWENARGCKIEHECAKEYGIKIMYQCKECK